MSVNEVAGLRAELERARTRIAEIEADRKRDRIDFRACERLIERQRAELEQARKSLVTRDEVAARAVRSDEAEIQILKAQIEVISEMYDRVHAERDELKEQSHQNADAYDEAKRRVDELKAERDAFRIEADECLHQVDDVELKLSLTLERGRQVDEALASYMPDKHHNRCSSRTGEECDCYMTTTHGEGMAARAAWRELFPVPDEITQEGERAENPNYVEGRNFDKETEDHLTEASERRRDTIDG